MRKASEAVKDKSPDEVWTEVGAPSPKPASSPKVITERKNMILKKSESATWSQWDRIG